MRTQKHKAFTLVELIVVITILAILGTIAFISLQGYSQDAKNSKVTSDMRTLISAIETASTESNDFAIVNLVKNSGTLGTPVSSGTYASGTSITSVTYKVGHLNFPFIKQSDTDFKDSENHEYIAALISDPNNDDDTFYQVAGQTKNAAGTYDAIVKGSYLKIGSGDIDGLIAGNGYPNGITNDSISMTGAGIY